MPDEYGSGSAILKAVSAGRPRQVRLLIESGIRLSVVDDCLQGPLIRAVFVENNRNQIKVVKLLLKYGAKVSLTDVVGRNALHWACIYGKDRLVCYLLAHSDVDLDPNQVDMNGCTALFHAASSGSAATVKRIVDALLKYSLSVDVPNFNGMTPLMQAMRGGHDVSASILIHQGNASTTVRDREFRSAYDWAEMRPKKIVQPKQAGQSFLPIIPNKVASIINYREYNAARQRRVGASDSDDEYDSSYGSDDSAASYATFDDETQTINIDGSQVSKVQSSYKSIQYPSPELDFEDSNGLSSSTNDADDVDDQPNCKLQYKELRKLYDLLQHQLNDSFRPGYDIRHANNTTAGHCTDLEDGDKCNAECCTGYPVAGDRGLLIYSDENIQRVVQANRKNKKNEPKKENHGQKRSSYSDLRKKVGEKSVQRAKLTLQTSDTNNSGKLFPQNASNRDDENTTKTKNLSPAFPELTKGKVSLVSNLRRQSVDKAREEFERLLCTTGVSSLYD